MDEALNKMNDFTKRCLNNSPSYTGTLNFSFLKGELKSCKKEQHYIFRNGDQTEAD